MRPFVGLFCILVTAPGLLRAEITVAIEKDKEGQPILIAVGNLEDVVLKACAARDTKSPDWSKAARVQVGGGSAAEIAARPAMLGNWRATGRVLQFEPRFPLLPGTAIRVTIDPPLLADPIGGKSNPLVFDLQTPAKDLTPVTKLTRIYPTTGKLPENHLRFYIHFSGAMRQGDAYEHIKLLDAKGKPLEDVFLELGEELWNPNMTRFTLLFHPGRVKKGLKPREELGPILEAGKSYTLVISGQWKDAEGRLLLDKEYRKEITAGPADDEPIDPMKWKLIPPSAGRAKPFAVRFPEPLDHGLLQRVLTIVDEKGTQLEGKVEVAEEETLWSFTPVQPWQPGKYRLVAESILEDLAANRIGRAFEVEMLRPMNKTIEAKTVELPFEVKTGANRK